MIVSDDGVPFEMCDIRKGYVDASQSQPATLYARDALTYAKDAATGVTIHNGQRAVGGSKIQDVTYRGDTNLTDPVDAPFVTRTPITLKVHHPVDGLPRSIRTAAVTEKSLWGNQYGATHGGVCNAS
jgi:hypothetical protein